MWVVPPRHSVVAVLGGVQLDLREARFSQREVTIDIFTLMGGVDITVGEDVEVDVSGFGIMGGFDHRATGPGLPGAPRVRVVGLALMGGVNVKRRPVKQKNSRSRRTPESARPRTVTSLPAFPRPRDPRPGPFRPRPSRCL